MKGIKHIKCLKDIYTKSLDGKLLQTEEIVFERSYDQDGNKISETNYLHDEPEHEFHFEYDDKNRLIKERSHFLSDELEEITEYFYDDTSGKLLKKVKQFPGGETSITTYSYSGENLVEKETRDGDGELEEKEKFIYENNKLIKHEVYNWTGGLTASTTFTYDNEGKILQEERWIEGEDTLKAAYTYLVKDQKPDITLSNAKTGRVIEAWRHRYDDKGRLIEEVIESIARVHLKVTTKYSYDEKDRVAQSLKYNFDVLENKTTYTYQEDLVLEEISETIDTAGNFFKDSVLKYEYEKY